VSGGQNVEPNTIVPDGHRIDVFNGLPFPTIRRTSGGALVACTGFGGDDQLAEVSHLLDRIEEELSSGSVRIARHVGMLSDLFAPHQPETELVPSAVALLFQENALAGADEHPNFPSNLVRRLRSLATVTCVEIYVDGPVGHELRCMLSELRSPVRRPAQDGAILLDVHRPDGLTITAFVGLVTDVLAERIVPDAGKKLPARAPRLARHLLSVAKCSPDNAVPLLLEHLATRAWHFALIASRGDDGQMTIAPMQWPGYRAFAVYPDSVTFGRAARDLGLAPGSFAMAGMPPATLFDWAIAQDIAISLCVYADDGGPLYIPIAVNDLRALQARVPR
jgi:hypothetical protein